MPSRNANDGSGYSYGFQGQEKDNEIKGNGNSVNYKYRMHDPRIGRFFAVDPLASSYPFYSPYAFSGNQVIHMVELEGLEPSPSEALEMSEAGYESDGKVKVLGVEKKLSGGWEVYENAESEINGLVLKDAESGYKATLYRRKLDNGEYEYTLATAGTEFNNLKDIKEDVKQALGNSEQYELQVENARVLLDKYGPDGKVTFVGHSLGGGLAAAGAYATGYDAITFNAAGVSDATKRNNELYSSANIDAYVASGEAVNYFLPSSLRADGNVIIIGGGNYYSTIELAAAYMISIHAGNALNAINIYRRGKAHMIEHLKGALETYYDFLDSVGVPRSTGTTVGK